MKEREAVHIQHPLEIAKDVEDYIKSAPNNQASGQRMDELNKEASYLMTYKITAVRESGDVISELSGEIMHMKPGATVTIVVPQKAVGISK